MTKNSPDTSSFVFIPKPFTTVRSPDDKYSEVVSLAILSLRATPSKTNTQADWQVSWFTFVITSTDNKLCLIHKTQNLYSSDKL